MILKKIKYSSRSNLNPKSYIVYVYDHTYENFLNPVLLPMLPMIIQAHFSNVTPSPECF